MDVAKEMKHLHELARRDPTKRFTHLWGAMSSESWLTQAWEEIRRNRGSMTPGINQRTVNGAGKTQPAGFITKPQ
jgi:hypothetical protein